jgi:hypothetical protein
MLGQEADLAFVGNKPVLEKLREPTLKWLGLFELIQRIFQ